MSKFAPLIRASAGVWLALCSGCEKAPTEADTPGIGSGISVVSAFAYPAEAGADVGVAYVNIANAGTEDSRLVSAESPAAGQIELHATVVEDGVVKMEHQAAGFPIAAGETLTMEPGDNHIMLMSIQSALVDGATVPMDLHFANGESLEIDIHVSEDGVAQSPRSRR